MASPRRLECAKSQSRTWRPAVRSVPSLHLPQNILVDYLTTGHGYDSESTGSLVKEGNRLFELRQLKEAAEVFGAAYEIGRLHHVYPPLMHDLVLRRVLCLSMLGDTKRAVHEVELALQIVPHAPTTYLICGILYSKLHRTDDANFAFHHAAEQCRLLRDLIECVVALFAQARGHCDHAIEICTEVLRRTPRLPVALFVRSAAYKCHASGYFEKQAAADVAALLEEDRGAAPLLAEELSLDNNMQMEEVLLHFHPWLSREGPRPYEDYPLYFQKQPFLRTSLVTFAVAKLRTLVRSSRLVRSVREKHEQLMQQRAAAERRMQELVEAQRNFAHLEQHTEVWGPADPDHMHVRKYRRYWMERPSSFPQRETLPHNHALTLEKTPAVRGQTEAAAPVPSPVSRALSSPFPSPARPALSPPPPPLTHGATFPQPSAQLAAAPPVQTQGVGRLADTAIPAHEYGAVAAGAPLQPVVATAAPAPLPHGTTTAPAPPLPSGTVTTPAGNGASAAPRTPVPATSASPPPPAPSAQALRLPPQAEACVEEPPPPRIGADWTHRQWFLKALELAEGFSKGQGVLDLRITPSCSPPEVPDHKPCREKSPPPKCRLSVVSFCGLKEENPIEKVEKDGFDALPDWYGALDRIYDITDMAVVTEKPEPFVGDMSRAGEPGYSYLVTKNPVQSTCVISADDEEARTRAHEALMQRYQNRLLVTTMPHRLPGANPAAEKISH